MRCVAAALAALPILPQPCSAGAFNEPAGHGQVIVSRSRSGAAAYIKDNGVARLPVDFNRLERTILIDYGLTDRLMATLKWTHVQASGTAGATYDDRGPTMLGLQMRLPSVLDISLAAQVLQHLPSRTMRSGSWLYGQTRPETEFRLLFGKTTTAFGRRSFIDVQAGYRMRGQGLGREWHIDFTHGVDLTPSTTLLVQTFDTRAAERPGKPYALFEQRKRQVSLVRKFGAFSVQVGAFRTLSGRRSYVENGTVVALWTRF